MSLVRQTGPSGGESASRKALPSKTLPLSCLPFFVKASAFSLSSEVNLTVYPRTMTAAPFHRGIGLHVKNHGGWCQGDFGGPKRPDDPQGAPPRLRLPADGRAGGVDRDLARPDPKALKSGPWRPTTSRPSWPTTAASGSSPWPRDDESAPEGSGAGFLRVGGSKKAGGGRGLAITLQPCSSSRAWGIRRRSGRESGDRWRYPLS